MHMYYNTIHTCYNRPERCLEGERLARERLPLNAIPCKSNQGKRLALRDRLKCRFVPGTMVALRL